MAEIPKISGVGNNTDYQISKAEGSAPGPSFSNLLQEIKEVANADVYVPKVGETGKAPSFFQVFTDKVLKGASEEVNTYAVLMRNNNIDGIGQLINYKDTEAIDKIADSLTAQPFVKIEPNKDTPKYLRTGGVDSVA